MLINLPLEAAPNVSGLLNNYEPSIMYGRAHAVTKVAVEPFRSALRHVGVGHLRVALAAIAISVWHLRGALRTRLRGRTELDRSPTLLSRIAAGGESQVTGARLMLINAFRVRVVVQRQGH